MGTEHMCAQLGVYRKHATFIAGRCKANLHEMTGYNLGRTNKGGVYCRECWRFYLVRYRAKQALTRYWRLLGMDGRAVPSRSGKDTNPTANLAPLGSSAPLA